MGGPLPVFEFRSGFWVNLHHFLYHEARVRELRASPESKSGPALNIAAAQPQLAPADQKIWTEALDYYSQNFIHQDPVVNIDLVLLKNQLNDFEDCDELTGRKRRRCDAGLPGKIGPILESAAPIYRKYWWRDQDRANRRWVAAVAPLIREQGVGLALRLADVYQTKWPREKIQVDVVAFANAAGAYTTLDPIRVVISSTDTRNQGDRSLEVLFHEASHAVARPVEEAIDRECRQRDKPIPRNLWHALVYYTTGEVLRPVMPPHAEEARGTANRGQRALPADLTPEEVKQALSERGWDKYLKILTLYWQPYLEGKVNFEDAIAHLVSAS